jgi:hypothetical protein
MESTKKDDDSTSVRFMYSKFIIDEMVFSNDDMKFIDENMFSNNNGKLVDYDSHSVIPLEYHLYETLDVYLNQREERGAASHIGDEVIESETEIITLAISEPPEVEKTSENNIVENSAVVEEPIADAVVDNSPCDSVENTVVSVIENNANNIVADIDAFIRDELEVKGLEQLVKNSREIGSGAYGTAYEFGGFVVKIPVNEHGHTVDFSDYNASGHPERASRYLNGANDDPNFSRAIEIKKTNDNEEKVDVLVSRYIEGKNIRISERKTAETELNKRGFYMHDAEVRGNILKGSDGKYYFIDADQIVISEEARKQRRPSLTTVDLEEMLRDQRAIPAHRERQNGDVYGVNIRKFSLIERMIAAGKSSPDAS